MNIVINKEKRIDENGREYLYTEYDKKLSNGTPYSVKQYLPTSEELRQQAYNVEEQNTINDVKILQDKMLIGEATQTDVDNRLAQWEQWKIDNGWV